MGINGLLPVLRSVLVRHTHTSTHKFNTPLVGPHVSLSVCRYIPTRYRKGEDVDGKIMTIVAAIGVGFNILMLTIFHEFHNHGPGENCPLGHDHSDGTCPFGHEHHGNGLHHHHNNVYKRERIEGRGKLVRLRYCGREEVFVGVWSLKELSEKIEQELGVAAAHQKLRAGGRLIKLQRMMTMQEEEDVLNLVASKKLMLLGSNTKDVEDLRAQREDTAMRGFDAEEERAKHRRANGDHSETSAQETKKKKKEMNLNVRSAVVHIIGDLVQSVGVLIAGVIIWWRPEYRIADPLCTFFFALLVLVTTWPTIREVIGIIMERTPRSIAESEFDLYTEMKKVHGVVDVYCLHVWSLTTGKVAMTAHIVAAEGKNHQNLLLNMQV